MELNISENVIAVTGASKGIGYAIAKGFASEGANIAICARGEEQLFKAKKDIEESYEVDCIAIPCDLTSEDDASKFINECINQFGRLDTLVNNAGSAPGGLLEELDENDWYKAINLKMMGHVRCMNSALPYLSKTQGTVINITGNTGFDARPSSLTSSAVNAADINMTNTLSKYYGRKKIRINGIAPGPVLTDRYKYILESIADQYSITPAVAKQVVEHTIPLERICQPEEIANVAVFLASEKADFINGETIQMDGSQQVDLYELEQIKNIYKLLQ